MDQPYAATEITSEWLGAVLASRGLIDAPSEVTAVEVLPTAKAGLTSSTSRVQLSYADESSRGPRSVIAKLPSSDPTWRKMTNRARIFEREARFYTDLRHRFPLRTPRCLFELVDYDHDRCVLLLEELTDVTSIDEARGATPEQAGTLLSGLARVHAEYWADAQLASAGYLLPISPPDARNYHASFERAQQVFAAVLSPDGIEIGRHFADGSAELYRRLGTAPPTFVHNDFRLDNLFLDASGTPVVIDFQAYAFSSPAIDLAMFITLSLDPVQRRAHEVHLLDGYASVLADSGIYYPTGRLLEDYRSGLLYLWPRIVVPAGAAADPTDARLFAVLSSMIERTQHALADHDCSEILEA